MAILQSPKGPLPYKIKNGNRRDNPLYEHLGEGVPSVAFDEAVRKKFTMQSAQFAIALRHAMIKRTNSLSERAAHWEAISVLQDNYNQAAKWKAPKV